MTPTPARRKEGAASAALQNAELFAETQRLFDESEQRAAERHQVEQQDYQAKQAKRQAQREAASCTERLAEFSRRDRPSSGG